jgi:hypothetical protein
MEVIDSIEATGNVSGSGYKIGTKEVYLEHLIEGSAGAANQIAVSQGNSTPPALKTPEQIRTILNIQDGANKTEFVEVADEAEYDALQSPDNSKIYFWAE